MCKDCGGSAICPHGRIKRQCKECGGSSICPHGKRKGTCQECGGSSIMICPHGRIKYKCQECGSCRMRPNGIGRIPTDTVPTSHVHIEDRTMPEKADGMDGGALPTAAPADDVK